MEINENIHQFNYGDIHMNTEDGSSNVNRPTFDAWRKNIGLIECLILNKGGEIK